jgi:DNA-binding transcriptional MerR regulator
LNRGSSQGPVPEMAGFPELTIGEVARRAGMATSSIRYYERVGLLPKPDRLGGQRRYDPDVLGRLGFIGVAQRAGFKLREIEQLIDSADGLGPPMRSLSSQKARRGRGSARAHQGDEGVARGSPGVWLRDPRGVRPVPSTGRGASGGRPGAASRAGRRRQLPASLTERM